jgi:predicted MFS family arabinose efflux permease
MVLMILPIGSGGALGLWAAIASEWAMKTNMVALVGGVLGGVAAVVGAVSAGFLYDRWGRRTTYCGFGLALAAVTILMGLLPKTPEIFVAGTLTYAAVIGGCYAGYSAVTLETIGLEAAATKFSLLASIANVPIALMIQIDGYLHDHYGANGMLLGEADIGIMAVLGFGALAWWLQRSSSISGGLNPEQQI